MGTLLTGVVLTIMGALNLSVGRGLPADHPRRRFAVRLGWVGLVCGAIVLANVAYSRFLK